MRERQTKLGWVFEVKPRPERIEASRHKEQSSESIGFRNSISAKPEKSVAKSECILVGSHQLVCTSELWFPATSDAEIPRLPRPLHSRLQSNVRVRQRNNSLATKGERSVAVSREWNSSKRLSRCAACLARPRDALQSCGGICGGQVLDFSQLVWSVYQNLGGSQGIYLVDANRIDRIWPVNHYAALRGNLGEPGRLNDWNSPHLHAQWPILPFWVTFWVPRPPLL